MAVVQIEHTFNGGASPSIDRVPDLERDLAGQTRDGVYGVAEAIIGLALLSLFLPLKLRLGIVQIRPFDFLTVILFLMALGRLRTLPAPTSWIGFVVLIPYLIWHVVSAFMYTEQNGLREALQIVIISLFAFSVCVFLPVMRFRRIFPIMLLGMAAITAYNAYHHISAGVWFGWKNLGTWSTGDIKYTFEFLPPLIGVLILFTRGRLRYLYWAIWVLMGAVIVFSGERKALLAFGLLTAALMTRARLHIAVPVLIVTFFAVSWVSTQLEKGYLSQQLSSISNYTTAQARNSFEMIVRGAGPASPSDSQRIFAFHVGGEMLRDHLLFGVGTNAYQDLVSQKYVYAPPVLLTGIHGEFWRVLVENGVIGFVLYVSIWLIAAYRLTKGLVLLIHAGALDIYAARLLFLFLMLPAGFSIAFEAPGTHAFVALILISFSPELIHYTLRKHLMLAASSRRDVGLV